MYWLITNSSRMRGCRSGTAGTRPGVAGERICIAGAPEKIIQAILRHANVSTMATYYIKTAAADAQAAMAKLETALIGRQTANRRGVASEHPDPESARN